MPEPISNELQPSQLKAQVKVDFQHFVGNLLGDARLRDIPDAMTPAHTDLLKRRINELTGRPHNSPGQLKKDESGVLHAVDPLSPIGQIEQLQEFAKANTNTDPKSIKELVTHISKQLVEITNQYATSWNNTRFEVVNGNNFKGLNLNYFTSRSLMGWRKDLLSARSQAIDSALFTRWDDRPSLLGQLKTPSYADLYLYTHLSSTTDVLSGETQRIFDLLASADGYVDVSELFFGGDMLKPFVNISAILRMADAPMLKDWHQFRGNVTEFRSLKLLLQAEPANQDGIDGYLHLSEELYGGDMHKTFINISAVSKMGGTPMPKGWQSFQGSTSEFRSLRQYLHDNPAKAGLDDYIRLADELYGGDMSKTFQNISAVSNMSGLQMPEGWQSFQGSTSEFRSLRQYLHDNPAKAGLDDYIRLADEFYGGAMPKTFVNVSAVSNMSGLQMPEGWHNFQGSTSEFSSFKELLQKNPSHLDGLDGFLRLADEFYGGAMPKTFVNVSAVSNMSGLQMPEGWHNFQGSTSEFSSFKELLQKNPSHLDGLDGFLRLADEYYGGDMLRTFKNISAVSNMSELPMPKEWRIFQGSTTEFQEQLSWLKDNLEATTTDFIDRFYKGNRNLKIRSVNFNALRFFLKVTPDSTDEVSVAV